jgi:hypothetical protein
MGIVVVVQIVDFTVKMKETVQDHEGGDKEEGRLFPS